MIDPLQLHRTATWLETAYSII